MTTARDFGSRTAVVVLGRIFYRDDLLARLSDPDVLPDATDADLVLAAYRRKGRAGIERLEGEYALVVCDGERGKIWAQRDPLGSWPLYWSIGGGEVTVGHGPGGGRQSEGGIIA